MYKLCWDSDDTTMNDVYLYLDQTNEWPGSGENTLCG